ncbi:hypothetical protein A5731_00320 [Mycolicibacterium conceptionense]|uniref:hypothetical protein n=1 Tax=Mycolicibacterium TaxID=1866885 RepID=UPI0007EBEA85|nr:hypothetical protein [Mycolicibacterium conceptionense]OBB15448.1 hypothetical protein A5718_29710 [Mycolicibacterium conceptionense]OBF09190.1 hypothetical protein A5731_00320 [Mycolicibacterium conceptionense]
MAISAYFYTSFFKSSWNKEVDIDGSTSIYGKLLTASYTPNQDTHRYESSLTNEVVGTGYTAGGKVITNPVVNLSTKKATFDGDDLQWTGATLIGSNAPRYLAVIDKGPGSAAANPLILLIDFGDSSYAPNGGTLGVSFNVAGIAAVTVS